MNKIICGDARELSKDIKDNSVDLIFTDPPYIKKYMYLYDWLGNESKRILKPNGFLLTYVGTYWKDKVMYMLNENLEYFWDYVAMDGGNKHPFHFHRKTFSLHKNILAYKKYNSSAKPHFRVLSIWKGGGYDKRFHVWGQDESTARYYIDCFSLPGMLILDPFCGGGTVPAVCKKIKRNFIAFDIDEESVKISLERLQGIIPGKEPVQQSLEL